MPSPKILPPPCQNLRDQTGYYLSGREIPHWHNFDSFCWAWQTDVYFSTPAGESGVLCAVTSQLFSPQAPNSRIQSKRTARLWSLDDQIQHRDKDWQDSCYGNVQVVRLSLPSRGLEPPGSEGVPWSTCFRAVRGQRDIKSGSWLRAALISSDLGGCVKWGQGLRAQRHGIHWPNREAGKLGRQKP